MADIERKAFQDLASEVKQKSDEAAGIIESLKSKMSNSEAGLSFLQLKNLLMLDYMTNLTYLMLRKSFGKSIENDASIERLVENRTVLEKMRPIEKKLKYQIDKYIKVADSGTIPENDPMHFKPNLDALNRDSDENSDDNDDDDEDAGGVGGKKYVAPKHVPAYFNQDENPETLEKEREEKVKKRILSRGLIDDLKRQHLDTPEEIFDAETAKQSRQVAYERERTRFEEDNFMRLPETKKEKKAARSRQLGLTMGRLGDEITHDFGKSTFGEDDGAGGRKRKRKSGKKTSSKKFKRRK